MIVWRTKQIAKRGHTADVVALQKEWNAKYANDSRVKAYRLLSSHIGVYEVVINEIEFESMAYWESFYSDFPKAADFSNWLERHYEMTAGFDHDFWLVEDKS
jgi:alpha-glucuronidase